MNNDDVKVMLGVCRFCGQTQQVRAQTQEEADAKAALYCKCDGARQAQRIEKVILDAKDRARGLFGAEGETDGFAAVDSEQVLTLIFAAIELTAYGELQAATLLIDGHGAAKITRNKSGGVKIERSRTLKRSEETV